MTAPEPIVTATSYRVSCLPFDHPDCRHYALAVTYRTRGAEAGFAVTDGEVYFSQGGFMTDVAVLMPLDQALALAKRIVPGIVVGDRTVADVLAQGMGE